MKIAIDDYDKLAVDVGLSKAVVVEEAVKDLDGIETKAAVLEQRPVVEAAARCTPVPVDAAGNPVDWHNLAARAGMAVFHRMTDVTPAPDSTPEDPKPPLATESYVKLSIAGKQKAAIEVALQAKLTVAENKLAVAKAEAVQALYEARLTAAKATVEAAKELPAPVEGELEPAIVEGELP